MHHIVLAGKGKRKVHAVENIITLCGSFVGNKCHSKMHEGHKENGEWISQKVYQEWAVNWSRERYGPIIDQIKKATVQGRKWNP